MVIVFHVMSALASVGYGTYLFFRPSKRNFRIYYTLIGTTLASGTYLVVSLHTNLLHSCATGLAYLAVVSCGAAVAHYRLDHT